MAKLASYIPCIPSIPRERGSDAGNVPSPIKVIDAGAPEIFTNSLTNFDALGPEFIQPPPT